MLPHIVISIGPASRGRAHVLYWIYLRYFISQDLHPSGIIRVHPVDPCSSHGFDPAIHRYRYRHITALPVCPVCVPRLSACPAQAGTVQAQAGTGRHRQAQAGVPTAQVEDTNPKRTISIESPPCRPDLEDEATSFRKTSDPSNWERIDPDSDPDSEKKETRRLNPLPPPLGLCGNGSSPIMLLDIVISIVPPRDGNAQGRSSGGPHRPSPTPKPTTTNPDVSQIRAMRGKAERDPRGERGPHT